MGEKSAGCRCGKYMGDAYNVYKQYYVATIEGDHRCLVEFAEL